MKLEEFTDKIFDILNESDDLMVRDIMDGEEANTINVFVGSSAFKIRCELINE